MKGHLSRGMWEANVKYWRREDPRLREQQVLGQERHMLGGLLAF